MRKQLIISIFYDVVIIKLEFQAPLVWGWSLHRHYSVVLLPSAVIVKSSTFCSEIVISKLFETQFQIICAQQL